MHNIKQIVKTILTEDGVYSLPRIASAFLTLAFLVASGYLILRNQTWGNYESFATFCGGGGIVGQLGNKLINSKWNTAPGEPGKPAIKKGEEQ